MKKDKTKKSEPNNETCSKKKPRIWEGENDYDPLPYERAPSRRFYMTLEGSTTQDPGDEEWKNSIRILGKAITEMIQIYRDDFLIQEPTWGIMPNKKGSCGFVFGAKGQNMKFDFFSSLGMREREEEDLLPNKYNRQSFFDLEQMLREIPKLPK